MASDDLIPADTTAEAHDLQGQVYRAMDGAERVTIAFALTDMTRRLTEAGLRRRHPGYTDDQVMRARARIMLGDVLTRAVWPNQPLVEP